MRYLGVGRRGHEDGVPRPRGIDAVESLVVLSDDEHLVGAARAADADEPIGEEGEVGPGDRGEKHGAVARGSGEGRGLLERVCAPRGDRGRGGAGGAPGEEEGGEEEEREEGEEVGEREEGERTGWGGGSGGGGNGDRVAGGRRLLVRPLVERHCRSPEIGVPASREARTAGGGRSSVE